MNDEIARWKRERQHKARQGKDHAEALIAKLGNPEAACETITSARAYIRRRYAPKKAPFMLHYWEPNWRFIKGNGSVYLSFDDCQELRAIIDEALHWQTIDDIAPINRRLRYAEVELTLEERWYLEFHCDSVFTWFGFKEIRPLYEAFSPENLESIKQETIEALEEMEDIEDIELIS